MRLWAVTVLCTLQSDASVLSPTAAFRLHFITFDSRNILVGMKKRARKKSKQNRVSSLSFYVKLSAYETHMGFSSTIQRDPGKK